MVDGGAPQVSLAQVEFEQMAARWQDEAKRCAEQAAFYTALAGSLKETYRHLIDAALTSQ